MTNVTDRKGHCLCGDVHIVAVNAPSEFGACHCGMCRRWGGGPFLELDCGTGVRIDGEDKLTAYDSSPWAERGFCTRCGTHLFYRLKETGQYSIPLGVFDESDGLVFKSQIFIDDKPAAYAFANETSNMTAAEVFAKYAPPDAELSPPE